MSLGRPEVSAQLVGEELLTTVFLAADPFCAVRKCSLPRLIEGARGKTGLMWASEAPMDELKQLLFET